jgi:hypothetical protein
VLALACAFVFTALTLYGVISVEGARILLFAAWVICVIGTLISESVWGTIWPRGILVVLGVALVLGLGFWRLDGWAVNKRALSQVNPPQPSPASGPNTQNAIPKKEPPPQPPNPDGFLFKDSPLFTLRRKQLTAKKFTEFKAYLAEVGIDVPKGFPPIGIETDKTMAPHVTTSSGAAYHDTIWMKADQLDDPRMITQNYSGYVFSTLLTKPMIAKFQALPREEPLDSEARRKVMQEDDSRWNAELAMFRYFTWSYWGRPEKEQTVCPYHQSMLFVSYLWQIRETYGKDFTDRLLAYTTREMIDNPSEPNETFPMWFLQSISNANSVVDNKSEKMPAIRQILNQCGWLEPST